MNRSLQSSCTFILLAGLLTSSPTVAEPPQKAQDITLHFLVHVPKQGPKESDTLYATRRKKTHDELRTRVLYRYKTAHTHNAKATIKPSGRMTVTLLSTHSPQFLQAVTLGKGNLNIHQELDQSSLWESLLDPTSGAQSLIPKAIQVRDSDVHGLYLQSNDPAALKKFIDKLITPDDSQLRLVRDTAPGSWRTIWLGKPLLTDKMITRTSLDSSPQTGASFGQIQWSEDGLQRWQQLKEEATHPLVLAIDHEPITTIHRPELAGIASGLHTPTSSQLTFGCDAIWTGQHNQEECITLVMARASAPIPLKIVPFDK